MILRTLVALTVMITVSVGPATSAPHESIFGSVVDVIDGDTFVLEVEGKKEWVNLLAVDAPENNQPWGALARQALADIVATKSVRVELDHFRRDELDQLYGYVWVGELFVNLELVRNGYALWDFTPPNDRYDHVLLDAEFEAKREWRGMWKSPHPTDDDFSGDYIPRQK